MGVFRWSRSILGAFAVSAFLCVPAAASAGLPPGFSDHAVHFGLREPTSIAIAPGGTVFVGEKSGTIERFDGPRDRTPDLIADLSLKVMSAYDRGLESIALDPDYPERPYLYVSYTYDAPIGGQFPTWGAPNGRDSHCLPGNPDPGLSQGCVVSGRVAQLTIGKSGIVTNENVLVEDWCQQFVSHSVGGLEFDRTGALLVGGGEGANFDHVDTGDQGDPNACGDPPNEGGSLRAQDILTPGDPLGLSGSVIRIDPDTGLPAAGNPRPGTGNEGRITSFGLRNPFRIAIRPGTDELWIGDVGSVGDEEIDATTIDHPANFGWPCFEGPGKSNFQYANVPICEGLYADPSAVTQPWFHYEHNAPAVPGDRCDTTEGAISGLAFDSSRDFPLPYDGGLFFADFVRSCIWSFQAGPTGFPDRDTAQTFESNALVPVDLYSAKNGLYYADIWDGQIRKISYDRPTFELKVTSRPEGAPVSLAGRLTHGRPITVKRGARYRLFAPKRLTTGSGPEVFDHWNDGNRRIHEVKARRSRKFTAVYHPA